MQKDELYDSLFGTIMTKEKAMEKEIPVEEVDENMLFPFPNHPFKVKEDDNFKSLQESIRKYGIMEPVIVRKRKNDSGYEIISGHRRSTAARNLGIKKIPVIITDFDDDKATIMMIDGNKKRDRYDPSELAHAFKMRMEAESHERVADKDNSGKRTTSKIGKDYGMSERNVSNYIRLTSLMPELLAQVDEKHLKMGIAVELSYFTEKYQRIVYDCYLETGFFPDKQKMNDLKELAGKDVTAFKKLLYQKKNKDRKETGSQSWNEAWNEYFPENYTEKEKTELIIQLLDKWKKDLESSMHL